MNLEVPMPAARSAAESKNESENAEDEFGIWERVSQKALGIVEQERGAEAAEKAKKMLEDPTFKKFSTSEWDRLTAAGKIKNDPEVQDDIWAKGLAFRIENRLDH